MDAGVRAVDDPSGEPVSLAVTCGVEDASEVGGGVVAGPGGAVDTETPCFPLALVESARGMLPW
ncbi:hypothetical protein ACIO8G_18935 [Streptomyces sp. NPDC087219]|uniref:hypothetical protein n=1 Tax=unclassified Streptomyces TaxID=2593676 RepID=UPI00382886EA